MAIYLSARLQNSFLECIEVDILGFNLTCQISRHVNLFILNVIAITKIVSNFTCVLYTYYNELNRSITKENHPSFCAQTEEEFRHGSRH